MWLVCSISVSHDDSTSLSAFKSYCERLALYCIFFPSTLSSSQSQSSGFHHTNKRNDWSGHSALGKNLTHHSWSSGEGISPAVPFLVFSSFPCHQLWSSLLIICIMSPTLKRIPASLQGMRSSFTGSYSNCARTKIWEETWSVEVRKALQRQTSQRKGLTGRGGQGTRGGQGQGTSVKGTSFGCNEKHAWLKQHAIKTEHGSKQMMHVSMQESELCLTESSVDI